MECGVQHGPELAKVTEPRRAGRQLWIGVVAVLGVLTAILIWQKSAVLDFLVPGFEVIQIHSVDKTMTLERANHIYLVQCGSDCGRFLSGYSYRMDIVEGELHYHSAGREFILPILEEEEVFTRPGGHG